MIRFGKLSLALAALAFCLFAAPLTATPAAAAPAATTVDMMRALEGAAASPVEQVRHRRWHRHHRWHRRHFWRPHCGIVKRCWRNRWGERRCRWVRRCW